MNCLLYSKDAVTETLGLYQRKGFAFTRMLLNTIAVPSTEIAANEVPDLKDWRVAKRPRLTSPGNVL